MKTRVLLVGRRLSDNLLVTAGEYIAVEYNDITLLLPHYWSRVFGSFFLVTRYGFNRLIDSIFLLGRNVVLFFRVWRRRGCPFFRCPFSACPFSGCPFSGCPFFGCPHYPMTSMYGCDVSDCSNAKDIIVIWFSIRKQSERLLARFHW